MRSLYRAEAGGFSKLKHCMAPALAATAFVSSAPGLAHGQEAANPAASEEPECAMNYFRGPSTHCDIYIPPGCLTPSVQLELRNYLYEPKKRKLATDMVVGLLANIPENSPVREPKIELGTEDNGAVLYNDQRRAQSVLALGRIMGAKWWRINIDPTKFKEKGDFADYQRAVKQAVECGYKIQTTIGLRGRDWTGENVIDHVKLIMNATEPGEVKRFFVGNESNDREQLRPSIKPKRTRAETLRFLFSKISNYIRKKDPSVEVSGFDLSSKDYPLVFADKVLECPPEENPCKPIIIDQFSIHPYLFTKSPTEEPASVDWKDYQIGINKLEVIEDWLDKRYKEGKIMTPDGKKPTINLNEHGYRNDLLGPEQRTIYYGYSIIEACHSKSVTDLTYYHVHDPPASWPGEWNSGQATPTGSLRTSFYLTSALVQRAGCVK
jgi:hypothetical protein